MANEGLDQDKLIAKMAQELEQAKEDRAELLDEIEVCREEKDVERSTRYDAEAQVTMLKVDNARLKAMLEEWAYEMASLTQHDYDWLCENTTHLLAALHDHAQTLGNEGKLQDLGVIGLAPPSQAEAPAQKRRYNPDIELHRDLPCSVAECEWYRDELEQHCDGEIAGGPAPESCQRFLPVVEAGAPKQKRCIYGKLISEPCDKCLAGHPAGKRKETEE